MASKKVRDEASTQPLAESHAASDPEAVAEVRRKYRKREATVYDAVAGSFAFPDTNGRQTPFITNPRGSGRVTSTLPLDDVDDDDDDDENDNHLSDSDATATYHRNYRYRRQPPRRDRRRDPVLAPEEVLFRRIGAPVRYAEKDIYHAHEALPNEGRDVLPDSDMVKAVHSYASHYYSALAAAAATTTTPIPPPTITTGEREDDGASSTPRGAGGGRGRRQEKRRGGEGNIDEQSMDETALLAFGILLEEAGREILGKRGDLVFTEGVELEEDGKNLVDGDLGPVGFLDAQRWKQRQSRGTTTRSRSKKKDEVH